MVLAQKARQHTSSPTCVVGRIPSAAHAQHSTADRDTPDSLFQHSCTRLRLEQRLVLARPAVGLGKAGRKAGSPIAVMGACRGHMTR